VIHFTTSRSGQDGEFERHGGHCADLPKLGDESRDFLIAHRGVMAARELRALRKKVRQMAAPRGRVFAGAKAARLRRV